MQSEPMQSGATVAMRALSVFFLSLTVAVLFSSSSGAATVREERPKMGSPFAVTAVHHDDAMARAAVEAAFAEIDRIEARISSWRGDSETSALRRHAGQGPFVVSEELFGLIRRSLSISQLTGGAFDVTFAGVGDLWDFKAPTPRLPDPDVLRRRLELVDYRLVKLDGERSTVELPKAGMAIGFGAIGKGYAANRAVHIMKAMGIESGLVNAGGDLVAFGRQESGEPWTLGIADPLRPDSLFARLRLVDQAVVTSGDYERYVEIDGVRYAHILDPRTGMPVRGVRSVTVVCPDGELADGLATSVFVLGVDEGLRLVDTLRGVEALVIDDEGRLHPSSGFLTHNLRSRDTPSPPETGALKEPL